MNTIQIDMVRPQLELLMESMLNRSVVVVVGNRRGYSHGYSASVGVVNQVQAEDGSGGNYNVELDNGAQFFCPLKMGKFIQPNPIPEAGMERSLLEINDD